MTLIEKQFRQNHADDKLLIKKKEHKNMQINASSILNDRNMYH